MPPHDAVKAGRTLVRTPVASSWAQTHDHDSKVYTGRAAGADSLESARYLHPGHAPPREDRTT